MQTFVRELIESFTRPHLAEDEDVFYCQIERLMDFLSRCANNVTFEEFDMVDENLARVHHLMEVKEGSSIIGFKAPIVRCGDRGRPSFCISREQLEYLLQFKFSVPGIARLFCVSVRTIRRRMSDFGLSIGQTYSDITDQDLKSQVSDFLNQCPNSG